MRIECAKSTKPLGVRGSGEAGFVFCPDPLASIQKGNRKKYTSTKVLLLECQKCDHYRGVHKSMEVEWIYTNPFGKEARIGEKKIVLSLCEADRQKEAEENWKLEELERMNFTQLREMAMKREIENIEDMSLSSLKEELLESFV
jgi:hypothetical protein